MLLVRMVWDVAVLVLVPVPVQVSGFEIDVWYLEMLAVMPMAAEVETLFWFVSFRLSSLGLWIVWLIAFPVAAKEIYSVVSETVLFSPGIARYLFV